MNELDKLEKLMTEAGIPFERYCELWREDFNRECGIELFGDNGKYSRNQIIYGNMELNYWKFDAICQYGSYGVEDGLIETYGELGCDENNNPRVMTADEAFEIIKKDWKKSNE